MALEGDEDYATIDDHPEDLPFKSFHFRKGKPLMPKISEPLVYKFSKEKPEGRELVDLQYNTLGLFIVSENFKKILEGKANIEFIPIQLIDHRGNVASDTHCLANILDLRDVIDKEKSECRVDPFDDDEFTRLSNLVFDEDKLVEDIHIFKIKQMPSTVIVDDLLAEEIKKNQLEGIKLVPIEEFDSAYFMGV